MSIKQLATTAAALIAFTTTTGDAATFTVSGTEYDLTTITGTFEDNIDRITSQVWWGDSALAASFASVTRQSLAGLPNSHPTLGPNIYGAFFAKGTGFNCPECVVSTAVSFTNNINSVTSFPDLVATFAVVEQSVVVPSVPLPAGGLLLMTGLAGAVGLRRRKTRSA